MRFNELMYVCAEMSTEQTNDGKDVIISCLEPGYISMSWEVEDIYRISYKFKSRCDKVFVFVASIDEFTILSSLPPLTNSTELWIEVLEDELVIRGAYFHRFMEGYFINPRELDLEGSENRHPSQIAPMFHAQIKGKSWYEIAAVAEIADINTWYPSKMESNVSLHFFKKWVNAIALAPNTVVTRMLPTQFEVWDNCNFTISSLPILKMDELSEISDNEPSIHVKTDSEFVLLEIEKPSGTVISITTKVIPGLIEYPQFHSTVSCREIKLSTDKMLKCLQTLTPQREIVPSDILRENVELNLTNSDNRLFLCLPNGGLGLILQDRTDAPDSEITIEANHFGEIISTIREESLYLTMPQKPGDPLLLGDNRGIQYTIFGYQDVDIDLESDIVVNQRYNDKLVLSEKMFLGVSCVYMRHLYTEKKLFADDWIQAKTITLMLATLTSYGYLSQIIASMGADCNEKIKGTFDEELAQYWEELYDRYKSNPYCINTLTGHLEQVYTEQCSDSDIEEFCFTTYRKINILLSRLDHFSSGTKSSFAVEISSTAN